MVPLPEDKDDQQHRGCNGECGNPRIAEPIFLLPAIEDVLQAPDADGDQTQSNAIDGPGGEAALLQIGRVFHHAIG